MADFNLNKLKTSWTKYSSVQVIEILVNKEVSTYLNGEKNFETSVLRSFLGIQKTTDPIPFYWEEIHKYPRQLRLFALMATIFTHHSNIKKFASTYAKGKMKGLFIAEPNNKVSTNIRSALIESGASSKEYRNQKEVPYDLSPLFEEGEVGKLFKNVLLERLIRIGYDEQFAKENFYKICNSHEFFRALSLTKNLFESWLEGESLNEKSLQEEYSFKQLRIFKSIPALKVNQWLNDWDDIDFKSSMRRKPEPYFLLFKIDARLLKRISDVHRRKTDKPRAEETFVQRKHNQNRSVEIKKYIEGGFPWSTIKQEELRTPENEKLKMPGMLPTAIIANIIGEGESRGAHQIKKSDLVTLDLSKDHNPVINIPDSAFQDNWNPEVKPIEIIDGQHRLWAFDENDPVSGNYELPVVAYFNLDKTWQAYLFYTINIKPVKINTSLGYDLYPLLRTQEWLEKTKDGLTAYRENRAQELVEILWRFPSSGWYKRINMIGESGGPTMSQASFIRALISTFLKSSRSANSSGGLFGDVLNKKNNQVIQWNRAQQAAFLVLLWSGIFEASKKTKKKWAVKLRNEDIEDATFLSRNTMLSRDQGVRGISTFANDFFYEAANSLEWDFNGPEFTWNEEVDDSLLDDEMIEFAVQKFKKSKRLIDLIELFSELVCEFDWRTTSAEFDTEEERNNQMRFKGGSGYSEIYKELLKIFARSKNTVIQNIIKQMR